MSLAALIANSRGAQQAAVPTTFVDLRGKKALIIDDSSAMRAMLRQVVTNMGVTSIDMSDTVADALFKVGKMGRQYDFILCDYILGDGKDGQQLLEEMRHRKLLPYRTVFIMVTAEAGYERVVNAVELAPDDYLIKPFSGDKLMGRLMEQIMKKALLAKLSYFMDAGEHQEAVAEADRLLAAQRKHIFEILRLKCEALMELHKLDDAYSIYTEILAEKQIPWARFGLARIEHLRNNLPVAEQLLENLISDAPRYTVAYDLLSEVKHDMENHQGAQEILHKGVALSPRNLRRNRKLGAAALLNGDLDTADKALTAVVQHGAHSSLLEAADYVNLARCSIAKGSTATALKQAAQGIEKFPDDKALKAANMFLQAQDLQAKGKGGEAQAIAKDAIALMDAIRQEEATIPPEMTLLGVEACLKAGLQAEASAMANDMLSEQQKQLGELRAATITAINQSFKSAGVEPDSEEMLRRTREEMAQINNQAVRMVQEGKLREAMELFKQAASGKSAQPVAILNAARAMLMVLDQHGWDDSIARELVYMLNRAKDKEPDSPKLAAMRTQWANVQRKYHTSVSDELL